MPPISQGMSTASRVVPDTSLTMVRVWPRMALVRLLLPTFGRPTSARNGGCAGALRLGSVGGGWIVLCLVLLLGDGFRSGEEIGDAGDEFGDATTMRRADAENFLEAQSGKLRLQRRVHGFVDLVDDEEHGLVGSTEHAGEFLVDGSDARTAINDEKDHGGRRERDVGLGADAFGEAHVGVGADAAGVDDLERVRAGKTALGDEAVAGNAGLVVDDGDLPTRQAVEEGGFADVGTAHDSNGGKNGLGHVGKRWRNLGT